MYDIGFNILVIKFDKEYCCNYTLFTNANTDGIMILKNYLSKFTVIRYFVISLFQV